MATFAGWQNFYVIVGSSAGALIGLQFVVLSLITDRRLGRPGPAAAGAFATPTIVHFGTVLGLSAMLCAPWEGIGTAKFLWGLVGLGGIIYAVVIARRMRLQTEYKPQFEDWVFHAVLPFIAYVTLAVAAFAPRSHLYEALFGVGTAALLLLYSGIHNAWDAVTFHVLVRAKDNQE